MIAANNYQVLGTRGPHPNLIGKSEDGNELDRVHAIPNLPTAHANSTFAG